MLAFFTTIGLMASLKVVKQGGILLLFFLIAVSVLAVLQNVLAHVNENLVCFTHDRVPLSNFHAEQLAIKVHPLRNRA